MFCALSLTFPRLACWCWWEPCHLARGANTTGQTLCQHIRIQTWLSVIPVQPVTSLLGATCRPQHQSDVSSRCQHQVGMTAVHLVVPACLPVHPDFFPGCTSPPVAVTGPHGAAPWPTAHTAAGGGRSKHTARKKRIIRFFCWISGSSLVECVCVCAGTHTWSRAECVSCSSLWQRVFAVWTLHCSLSSHTAWPSNTAFQWWLWKWAHRFNKLFISVNTNPGAKKKEVRVVTLLNLNVFLGPDCGDRCRNEHVVNLLTDMWFFLFWRHFFVRTF